MTAHPHVLLVPAGSVDPAEASLVSLDGIDCLLMWTTPRRARHYAARLKRAEPAGEDLEPLALEPEQVAAVLGGLVGKPIVVGIDAADPAGRPKYRVKPAELLGPLTTTLGLTTIEPEPEAEPEVEPEPEAEPESDEAVSDEL